MWLRRTRMFRAPASLSDCDVIVSCHPRFVRLALRLGGLLLAGAILWVLVDRLGAEAILAQLRVAGPGFVWILALHVLAISVAAVPWYLLLPRETRPPVAGAIASRFVAQGANAMLPIFGFGGELVRLFWLRRGDRAAGVAAIVVDRLMYGASSAVLLAAGLVGVSRVPALPATYTRATVIGIGVLLAAVAIGLVLASRYRMAGRIHRMVLRIRRKLDEDRRFGDDVDRHVEQMLHRRAWIPWLAALLHLLGRAMIGAEIVFAFWLLGASLGWSEALVFAALPVMVSVSGAIVPNQLGVWEATNALVAAAMGLSPTTAVAVVLLLRLRQLAGVIVIALILALRRSVPQPAAAA